ncbi:helix-turn-helix domain-containing protein [Photobacterium makurazakiensis]|uniref:helix-turn-helix domain-containing protein n=1 Tax=Photobacterium makurazakiensis TaxID=2910234 RepID=UPI003D106838
MNLFPQILKARRKELKWTQGRLALWLQQADIELHGVDVVSISRWEMGKTQPSVYKVLKILSILKIELLPFLKSLDVSVDSNIVQTVLQKRYQSFHSMISTANYVHQHQNKSSIECFPLLRSANDNQVLSGIHNLAMHTKTDTSLLNLVDFYLYQMTNRIHGRKYISSHNGELQGHSLGFFFKNNEFDQYQRKKVDFTKATPYSENKDLVYFITSTFSLSMEVTIDNILQDLKYFSDNPSIKRVAALIINPDALEVYKALGYETFKYSDEYKEGDEGGSLELNGRKYNYCVVVIDKLRLLSNKHIIDFIKKMKSVTKRCE